MWQSCKIRFQPFVAISPVSKPASDVFLGSPVVHFQKEKGSDPFEYMRSAAKRFYLAAFDVHLDEVWPGVFPCELIQRYGLFIEAIYAACFGRDASYKSA